MPEFGNPNVNPSPGAHATGPAVPSRAAASSTATFRVEPLPNGEVRLVFEGRLDSATSAGLWAEATGAVNAHRTSPITLDSSGLQYCDGAGIALLMELLRQPRPPSAPVRLGEVPESVLHLLQQFAPADYREVRAAPPVTASLPTEVGKAAWTVLKDLHQQVSFIGELFAALMVAIRHPRGIRWRDALYIADQAGVNALPIVALISILMGVILAFQSAIPMRQFGAEIFVANLVALSVLREIGPLMTAILLAGRSGSAFAAELGTMKINEELNALNTMGLDPVRFLVVTRVIAAVMVTPFLIVFADVLGVAGGALVMLQFDIPIVTYVNQVLAAVTWKDFTGGLMKGTVFALLVGGIGCLRGLQTAAGASAVGTSTTRAVVSGIVLIVLADCVFSVLYFYLGF